MSTKRRMLEGSERRGGRIQEKTKDDERKTKGRRRKTKEDDGRRRKTKEDARRREKPKPKQSKNKFSSRIPMRYLEQLCPLNKQKYS